MCPDQTLLEFDHEEAKRSDFRANGIRVEPAARSFYKLPLLATQINRAIANAYVVMHGRPANGWRLVTVLGRIGPLTASQIANFTMLEMDKITRIVDSLCDEGIVSRKQDRKDRRRVIVSLSAKGRRLNERIETMIAAVEDKFLAELTRSERETLYDLLDRLKAQGDKVFGRVGV